MKSSAQISLLQDFYRDRLALLHRHIEGAKRVADYEFNNTYQYVIAREELHTQWVRDAVVDAGGEVPAQITALDVPAGGKGASAERAIFEDDARQALVFHDKWRSRVPAVTNARHRKMLEVVLGEVLEHKRFFDQAAAGRDDLLGRRMPGASTGDGVLPVRWME